MDLTMAQELLIEQDGPVRVLRLNRPDKRNALDHALVTAIVAAMAEADHDAATRVVVLAAAGSAFCAGGDRSEAAQPATTAERQARTRALAALFGCVSRMDKPVIGAVRGPAVGGGACLALGCDLLLLGESARLAFPEVRNGIAPALVMPHLVRHVGPKVAFFLVATGEPVLPPLALALHLAHAVHPDDELESRALALAHRLADASPGAMAQAKRLFHQNDGLALAEGLELGRQTIDRASRPATPCGAHAAPR